MWRWWLRPTRIDLRQCDDIMIGTRWTGAIVDSDWLMSGWWCHSDCSLIRTKVIDKVSQRDICRVSVGLDAAGKTTILYKLKLGEIVTTIPTIGNNQSITLILIWSMCVSCCLLPTSLVRSDIYHDHYWFVCLFLPLKGESVINLL